MEGGVEEEEEEEEDEDGDESGGDDEEEAEEERKVLIMHEDRVETLWALGVQQMGVTPENVTWITQTIEEVGYKGM